MTLYTSRLQDEDKLLLTPFEKNLEVWRQLWRVIERSHIVVQIVDARNPLRFRCEDLEKYVRDVEGVEGEAGTGSGKRINLLLINKADLLTSKQRYFSCHKTRNETYIFKFADVYGQIISIPRACSMPSILPITQLLYRKRDEPPLKPRLICLRERTMRKISQVCHQLVP